MEYQKITNLLVTAPYEIPIFITKKCVKIHHQSGHLENSKPSKPIRFKTLILRSDLCDFSDAYIVVEGKIAVIKPNTVIYDKKLAFKKNAPFVSCISKIINTLLTMQKI